MSPIRIHSLKGVVMYRPVVLLLLVVMGLIAGSVAFGRLLGNLVYYWYRG